MGSRAAALAALIAMSLCGSCLCGSGPLPQGAARQSLGLGAQTTHKHTLSPLAFQSYMPVSGVQSGCLRRGSVCGRRAPTQRCVGDGRRAHRERGPRIAPSMTATPVNIAHEGLGSAPEYPREQYYARLVSVEEIHPAAGISPYGVLHPLSKLCADVLYDAPHLAGSVQRDFIRRYGKARTNQGVVVAGFIEGVRDGMYECDKVVGCVGMEVVQLAEDGLPPPPPSASYFDRSRSPSPDPSELGIELRPLISNLSVAKEHRRKGVARKLMLACEEVVVGMGHDHVMLKVEDINDVATALYRSLGYREVGSVPEDKFVAGKRQGEGGVWIPTTNLCFRKDLL